MALIATSFGVFGWGILVGLLVGALAVAGIAKLRQIISK